MEYFKRRIAAEVLQYMITNPVEAAKGIYFQKKRMAKAKYEPLRTVELQDIIGSDFPVVSPITFLSGGSTATDYLLLKGLSKKWKGGGYLEVGTWRGESLVNVQDNMDYCVSLTLKPEGIYKETANIFIEQSDKIEQRFVDSFEFDFNSLEKKFDLIFIDADHSYEGILNDTQKAFPLLRDENSVLVWHDYAAGNEVPITATLNAICDAIPNERHNNLYHVANTMCAIYYPQNIKSGDYKPFPVKPKHYFEVQIRQREL